MIVNVLHCYIEGYDLYRTQSLHNVLRSVVQGTIIWEFWAFILDLKYNVSFSFIKKTATKIKLVHQRLSAELWQNVIHKLVPIIYRF